MTPSTLIFNFLGKEDEEQRENRYRDEKRHRFCLVIPKQKLLQPTKSLPDG